MQLAKITKFKDDALEEIENVKSHLTAEHQLAIGNLTANHNCKVDQLTKQV